MKIPLVCYGHCLVVTLRLDLPSKFYYIMLRYAPFNFNPTILSIFPCKSSRAIRRSKISKSFTDSIGWVCRGYWNHVYRQIDHTVFMYIYSLLNQQAKITFSFNVIVEFAKMISASLQYYLSIELHFHNIKYEERDRDKEQKKMNTHTYR